MVTSQWETRVTNFHGPKDLDPHHGCWDKLLYDTEYWPRMRVGDAVEGAFPWKVNYVSMVCVSTGKWVQYVQLTYIGC